jgi:predicted nucleic acid-binding protein
MTGVLVDTNVLVYAYDAGDTSKQERALQVLDALQGAGIGQLSAQTLAEFFRVTTRESRRLLTVAEATEQVGKLARAWSVLEITPMIVLEAARGVRDHQLAYWDAQVWATARLNQIQTIFSEDFRSGSVVEAVHFVDPFQAEFDIAEWLS